MGGLGLTALRLARKEAPLANDSGNLWILLFVLGLFAAFLVVMLVTNYISRKNIKEALLEIRNFLKSQEKLTRIAYIIYKRPHIIPTIALFITFLAAAFWFWWLNKMEKEINFEFLMDISWFSIVFFWFITVLGLMIMDRIIARKRGSSKEGTTTEKKCCRSKTEDK